MKKLILALLIAVIGTAQAQDTLMQMAGDRLRLSTKQQYVASSMTLVGVAIMAYPHMAISNVTTQQLKPYYTMGGIMVLMSAICHYTALHNKEEASKLLQALGGNITIPRLKKKK